MSVFHHPHLTRGIVTTAKGSFVIVRGLVEAPDEVGESLGWQPVHLENHPPLAVASPPPPERALPASARRASARSSPLRKTERDARARLIRVKAASRSRVHMQSTD